MRFSLLLIFAMFCVLTAFEASRAQAQGFTRSLGQLSDRDFYRAVSCRAPPGQVCPTRAERWPLFLRGRLSISLAGVQGSDPHFVSRTRNALERAVAEINRANSGVQLRSVWGPQASLANIQVFIVEPKGPQKKIEQLSFPPLIGKTADPAVAVRSKLGTTILSAGIAIEKNPSIVSRLQPLMLEKILESLGLVWKIQNPFYETRSLFSPVRKSNLGRLTGQDLIALQLHYPR